MRGRGTCVLVVGWLAAFGCAGDEGARPTATTPPVESTSTTPMTSSTTVPTTVPVTTDSPTSTTVPATTAPPDRPADAIVLRVDGLGPVDIGTPADDAEARLTALLGPPDRVVDLSPGGGGADECAEGASWLTCVRDLRVVDDGRLLSWDDLGIEVALVDTDGRSDGVTPLQFGDWRATPSTGDRTPMTADGVHPGMTVGAVRRLVPDVVAEYGEGLLDAVSIGTPGGVFRGMLDWDPARPGNDWSELIEVVQAALVAHGADIAVDGEWGPRSQAAWEAFLRDEGVDPVPPTMWLTPDIGWRLDLDIDDFVVASLVPVPELQASPVPGIVPRPDGFGVYDFGDPADGLVDELVVAFGPPSDEVVFSAQPPDRLYLPGGYHALHDLAQFEWADPGFLVILSDTPFHGDHWGEAVPGTLHLIAWESTAGQLPLDSGVTVGSTFDQLRSAYRRVTVGAFDVCETDFDPAAFTVPGTFTLHGTLDWDWVSDLQEVLAGRGARLAVDGMYGPATTAAVHAVQLEIGLDGSVGADANGMIGPATIDALGLRPPDDAQVIRLQAGYPGSC